MGRNGSSRHAVHLEIASSTGGRVREFYARLFGWRVRPGPNGYGIVRLGEGHSVTAGFLQVPEGGRSGLAICVEVGDLDGVLERAEGLGGRTLMPPTPVRDVGVFALLSDPDGNAVGVFHRDA